MSTESRWQVLWNLPGSFLIGASGGAICGSLILSFGYLIGRGGDTPAEPFGTLSLAAVLLGAVYGGFFGAFVVPIAYVLVLKKTGFQRPLIPAFVGTLVGGFLGAIAGPPLAVLTGIIGFSIALAVIAKKQN
jgi:hypothetical protein